MPGDHLGKGVDHRVGGQAPRSPRPSREDPEARLEEIVAAQALLREVLDVTSRLAAAPDREAIASVLIEHGIGAFRADAGAVHLLGADGHTLAMAASRGWPERETREFEQFRLSDELPAAIALRSRTTVVFASREELRQSFPALAPVQDAVGDNGWIMVPISAGERAIGVIGLSFLGPRTWRAGERELLETLAATAGQALERAAAHEAATSIALDLQRALLPGQPADNDAFQSRAEYIPAPGVGEIGGDWYEVLAGPDDVLFVIGDVAGHGVEAARTMGAVRHGLAAFAHDERDPAALLVRTSDHLRNVDEEAMVTCIVMRLEYATRMLTWACAGHPPPVLVATGSVDLLETTTGAPLGVGGREAYHCTTRSAVAGEAIFLYTDGLIERRGEDLTTGFERLIKVAAANSDGGVDALVDGLLAELAPGSHDDIAVLAVQVS